MTCENNHFQLVHYSKRVRGRHYKPRQLLINWESPHFSRWKSNQDADGGTTGTILNAMGWELGPFQIISMIGAATQLGLVSHHVSSPLMTKI
jgi:hypothetical protein